MIPTKDGELQKITPKIKTAEHLRIQCKIFSSPPAAYIINYRPNKPVSRTGYHKIHFCNIAFWICSNLVSQMRALLKEKIQSEKTKMKNISNFIFCAASPNRSFAFNKGIIFLNTCFSHPVLKTSFTYFPFLVGRG